MELLRSKEWSGKFVDCALRFALAAVLSGARVSLYQDGALLYSGITGSDGRVSWMLPVGYSYRASATLSSTPAWATAARASPRTPSPAS